MTSTIEKIIAGIVVIPLTIIALILSACILIFMAPGGWVAAIIIYYLMRT